jgi:hypothetical protein
MPANTSPKPARADAGVAPAEKSNVPMTTAATEAVRKRASVRDDVGWGES